MASRRRMTENEVTEMAVNTILGQFIGKQPAIIPTFEIADEEGLRPDRVLAALDEALSLEEMKKLNFDDLVIHAVESKVERQYLISPEFLGVTQASDYWGNYNWLAVSYDVDLTDSELRDLKRACRRERIGFVLCDKSRGESCWNQVMMILST